MSQEDRAREMVKDGLRELQLEGVDVDRLDDSTRLAGSDSPLDSLGLVTLTAVLEERLQAELGRPVALLEEEALDLESSPFRTLGTLSAHVAEKLRE